MRFCFLPYICIRIGEVAEWSIAAVLKTVDCHRSGGSNPSLSAELTGQNRTMNGQVPQIQRFVGLFLSPYVCPTGHHLEERTGKPDRSTDTRVT